MPNLPTGQVSSHQIKLALGGLRFDKDLEVGWSISPTIGLVAKDIEILGLNLRSFKEPLERSVREVMIPSITRNFDEEGRPAWEPLSESTVNIRGTSGPILNRTGALKEAATSFSIWSIGETSATIRGLPSNVWYGAIHQQGLGGFGKHISAAQRKLGHGASAIAVIQEAFKILGDKKGKHQKVAIPQRRFIMYQEDDIDAIQLIFYEWLVEQTVKWGKFTK